MSGRRSHPRFAVATPWEGAMRVLRDVVISRADSEAVHAVSQVPAVVGEEMTLDVMGAGAVMAMRVKVVESKPLMVQGVVRHQVTLARVGSGAEREPREIETGMEVDVSGEDARNLHRDRVGNSGGVRGGEKRGTNRGSAVVEAWRFGHRSVARQEVVAIALDLEERRGREEVEERVQLALGSGFGLHHPPWNQLAEDRPTRRVPAQEFHRATVADAQPVEEGGYGVAPHHPFLRGETRRWRRHWVLQSQLDDLLDALTFQARYGAPGDDAEGRQHAQCGHSEERDAERDPSSYSGPGGGLR